MSKAKLWLKLSTPLCADHYHATETIVALYFCCSILPHNLLISLKRNITNIVEKLVIDLNRAERILLILSVMHL